MKYLGDILVFLPKEEMEKFFIILNEERQEIQFSYEVDVDHKLPYLNLLLVGGGVGSWGGEEIK